MPAASTATSVTSASPIISAAAVEAVRCGFRRALSRASAPGGAAEAVAPASRAPTRAAGRIAPRASRRRRRSAARRRPSRGARPSFRDAAEEAVERARRSRASVTIDDPSVRKRAKRDSGSVAPSRTAAIGGTRVARSAGRRLASSVTRMPTSIATITVRVAKTSPLFGSVKPTASKSLNSPFASPSPRNSPTIEASMPTTSASTTIELSTWRRVAPSVRSVANSRVRCAIVIESEFAITKLPTKSAMPPNASRKLPQERDERVRVLRVLCRLLPAPVRTCAFGGRIACDLAVSCVVDVTPGLRRDRDLVELVRACRRASAPSAGRSPRASRRRGSRRRRT